MRDESREAPKASQPVEIIPRYTSIGEPRDRHPRTAPEDQGGKQYLLVIKDGFTKLTQVVALRTVTAYTVVTAFCDAWVFKCGIPRSLLSDNGPQFNAKFFHRACRILGITNLYTSAYHLQTNGQVGRYNCTIASMLRNYVNEHQDDWDVYVGPLTYAYNSHVHRSTRTTPFELVLSRHPPEVSLRRTEGDGPLPDRRTHRAAFLKKLDETIQKAYGSLRRTQARYKRDFDKRVRRVNTRLKPGNYVYLDPTDGGKTSNKLASPAGGPYRVLANDQRTITIDRDGVTERVSADRCVYAPPPVDAPRTSTTAASDLADKVTAGTPYAVDRLLDHRVMENGSAEFKVKWADFEELTWTARTHIHEEIVSRYASRLRARTGKDLTTELNADVQP